ncbi:hypothetical protein EAE99_003827 [Botrytis elliptica]|nr:hypothetical protein EAE99_003827 [Botrytis elliptica]
MHEVYTFSKSVYVWLGTNDEQGATDGPKRTFDFLRSILDLQVLDHFADRKEDLEYCIEKSNSLDILCCFWAPRPKLKKNTREKVESTFEEEKMPSWITSIDRYAFGLPREAKKWRINGDSFVDESGRPQYNASSGLAPRVRLGKKINHDLKDDEVDPTNPGEPGVEPIYANKQENIQHRHKFEGIMYVEGFQLDFIKRRSDAVNGGVIIAEALKMGGYKKDPLTGKYEPHDTLWRTLLGDLGPAPNWYRRACAYFLDVGLLRDASGYWHTNDMKNEKQKKWHRQPCFNF